MPIILNCEGEPCPNPVLRCKQLLDSESPQDMQVIVDNDAAKENVSRYLASKGMHIDDMRKDGGLWTITASRAAGAEGAAAAPAAQPSERSCPVCAPKILVFITRDVIGQGDDTLGSRLMGNFLATLPELGDALWRIILVNGAVRLATDSNPASEHLKKLEATGVSILVCGTCLEFFKLMDRKVVGEVTNMLDVVTSQHVADKIITL
ncbi:sulfurtransferase-like selenium metabolism protein YedF [Desulfomicrobium escambiense]|uniref:sulfurtransferase-like selenium metabolism protein YedF n=1 Tax=Desulfomicrobium escambiense TaxID=29503 RepID=UPI000423D0DD|nr:sulfurtransferase-like selenium metabolism protein YedF [Desulfomicrobium escambiense]